jgi:hypothetical protein
MREIELRPRKRVLFQNREWAVTTRVVECIGDGKPDYRFRLERADEGFGDKFGLIWPVHMAEKLWCDLDAFIEAWLFALVRCSLKLKAAEIGAVIERARAERLKAEALESRLMEKLNGKIEMAETTSANSRVTGT